MDDVSYAPGRPNVLSMTKRLDPVTTIRLTGSSGSAADASLSRRDEGDRTVLRIEGVLDALTAPALRTTIDTLVAEQRKSIVVDLSSLWMIDSIGVGLIVGLFKRCKAFDGTVEVSGIRDQPLALFRLLRLERVFTIQQGL
jgi:anti-sigma B factor antagonist